MIGFFQGRDSVFGRIVSNIDEFFVFLAEKFDSLGPIVKAFLTVLTAPLRAIVNLIKFIIEGVDLVKKAFSEGLSFEDIKGFGGGIVDKVKNILGFDTKDLGSMFGFGSNEEVVSGIQAGQNFLESKRSKPQGGAAVQVQSQLNVNVEGMSQEQAEKALQNGIQQKIDENLRDAAREAAPVIAR